jgi:hypothetical protein
MGAADTVHNLPLAARVFLSVVLEDPSSGRAQAGVPASVDRAAVAPALHARRNDVLILGHAGAHRMVEWYDARPRSHTPTEIDRDRPTHTDIMPSMSDNHAHTHVC